VDTAEVEVSFFETKEIFLLIFLLTDTVLNGQLLSLYVAGKPASSGRQSSTIFAKLLPIHRLRSGKPDLSFHSYLAMAR
jgi:hypothetical protein